VTDRHVDRQTDRQTTLLSL